jgi:hypothetical protein
MPELGLTLSEREALLRRFSLFGIRLAASLLRQGSAATATDLARELADHSGLRNLQNVLGSLFFERRDVLKTRSALLALDTLTRLAPRPGSQAIAAQTERIMASAHPFNELRVLSSLRAGWVTAKPEVVAELERLIGGAGGAPHLRLQLPASAGPADIAAAASDALARWQRRAENPMTSHVMATAARVAVRSCEGMLTELGRTR